MSSSAESYDGVPVHLSLVSAHLFNPTLPAGLSLSPSSHLPSLASSISPPTSALCSPADSVLSPPQWPGSRSIQLGVTPTSPSRGTTAAPPVTPSRAAWRWLLSASRAARTTGSSPWTSSRETPTRPSAWPGLVSAETACSVRPGEQRRGGPTNDVAQSSIFSSAELLTIFIDVLSMSWRTSLIGLFPTLKLL